MKRQREKERRLADAFSSRGLGVGDVLFFDSVGSTMDTAFEIGGPGVRDRTLVVADSQTSGRGRFGRKWYSTADDLVFSLILVDFDIEAPYGMVAALAVLKAFRRYTAGVRLKWINDLLWEGRKKIAGVLVEERAGKTVIGIGVNLNTETLPPEVRDGATSLLLETGAKVAKEEFLLAVMEELLPCLDACREGRLGDLLEEWEAVSAIKGKRVVISSGGGEECRGTVIGLNRETGALVLSSRGTEVEMYEGHLTYEEEEKGL
jgi:BirA family biotin operon repressor/biotin-[acetyl-CoA-carboxylase] ligase